MDKSELIELLAQASQEEQNDVPHASLPEALIDNTRKVLSKRDTVTPELSGLPDDGWMELLKQHTRVGNEFSLKLRSIEIDLGEE